jgi:hypothetical protein
MLSLLFGAAMSASTASDALQDRAECVAFEWYRGKTSEKGAIIVPVTADGRTMRWQLDTGADVNMTYGDVAERAGLSKAGDKRFRVRQLLIGTTSIVDSLTFIRRDMGSEGGVTGTLGLNSLLGRIAVIDYPKQRFCLFSEANLPEPFWSATFAKAVLRDRKLFLPLQIGRFRSDALLFDTGASEVPLSIDAPLWHRLTGKGSIEAAEKRIHGVAWGAPVTLFGAPASAAMQVGDIDLGAQMLYTERTDDTFAASDYKIDGTIGNAPFWHGIVVLDLTVRMRFGFVKP